MKIYILLVFGLILMGCNSNNVTDPSPQPSDWQFVAGYAFDSVYSTGTVQTGGGFVSLGQLRLDCDSIRIKVRYKGFLDQTALNPGWFKIRNSSDTNKTFLRIYGVNSTDYIIIDSVMASHNVIDGYAASISASIGSSMHTWIAYKDLEIYKK